MEKQSQKNKKGNSSKQGNQTKKETDSRRSSMNGSATQCKDETDYSDCKD